MSVPVDNDLDHPKLVICRNDQSIPEAIQQTFTSTERMWMTIMIPCKFGLFSSFHDLLACKNATVIMMSRMAWKGLCIQKCQK